VAARTRRIRIGTEVTIAPFRHPLHLAEEVAVLDQISDGRVELGLGAGYMAREYEAFGKDRDSRFADFEATTLEVRRLLAETVTPRPIQSPVPIWAGYNMPVGARRAGRLGVGLMSVLRWCLEPYLQGLREGGHDPSTARMGSLQDLIVAEDPERARAALQPHIDYQAAQYAGYLGAEVGSGDPSHYLVLSPGEAIEHLRRLVDGLPVAFVTPWLSVGGMPVEAVREHVTLLMTEVAPAVADVGLRD
jgi:alkanesulfonate monooxygenase SsuD/methylene tetrahydromethanopterin reductase-like flavin-dependent oxidoreductase (luciferase family)